MFFFINAKYPTLIATFSAFTALAVLLLNYKGFYNAATYTFVSTTCFSVFVIVQQYEVNVGNYLYLFSAHICVALVHATQ